MADVKVEIEKRLQELKAAGASPELYEATKNWLSQLPVQKTANKGAK